MNKKNQSFHASNAICAINEKEVLSQVQTLELSSAEKEPSKKLQRLVRKRLATKKAQTHQNAETLKVGKQKAKRAPLLPNKLKKKNQRLVLERQNDTVEQTEEEAIEATKELIREEVFSLLSTLSSANLKMPLIQELENLKSGELAINKTQTLLNIILLTLSIPGLMSTQLKDKIKKIERLPVSLIKAYLTNKNLDEEIQKIIITEFSEIELDEIIKEIKATFAKDPIIRKSTNKDYYVSYTYKIHKNLEDVLAMYIIRHLNRYFRNPTNKNLTSLRDYLEDVENLFVEFAPNSILIQNAIFNAYLD